MAKCVGCGGKAAFMMTMCDPCYRRFEDARLTPKPPVQAQPPVAPASLRGVDIGGVVTAPGRPEIRAYVAAKVAEMMRRGAAGENPHHVILDHQDQLDTFAATLPESARADFLRIYTEESAVALAGLKQQVAAKENSEIYTLSKKHTMLSVAMTIALIVLLSFLLRAF